MPNPVPGPSRAAQLRLVAQATVVVIAVGAATLALQRVAGVLVLVFVALFLAVGGEPAVERLTRLGVRRPLAVVGLALLLAAVVVASLLALVVPAAQQLASLAGSVADAVARAGRDTSGTSLGDYLSRPEVQERVASLARSVVGHLDDLAGAVFGALGGVAGFVSTAATVGVLTLYFSVELPRMRAFVDARIQDPERRLAFAEALGKVGAYVAGQAVICLLAGTLSFVALRVIGVPYAALLALLVMLLDAVPQVGATIGSLLAIVVARSAGWPQALATALFFMLYQLLENNLIAPRVFSRTISVPPLAALLAVMLGFSLAGVLGALTALPATAAARVVLQRLRPGPAAAGGAAAAGAAFPASEPRPILEQAHIATDAHDGA
ncbi:AI-2E family transporter [Phycicoccus ginsengisoli]